MRWHRRALAGAAAALAPALAAALALALATAALAQPLVPPEPGGFDAKPNKPRLHFEVTVLHASPSPGGVGPGAERFDRLLRETIRYESLRVVKTKERRVELNEIERIALPTGQDFRFRPIDAGDRGVLVAIDWKKTARGDFRLPRGKPLILGGQPYENGQLVVILEAE